MLSGHRFRELDLLARALTALGCSLAVQADGEADHAVVAVGAGLRGAVARASRVTSLSACCAVLCRSSGISARALQRAAGIPYACAHRLVGGRAGRVERSWLRALLALGAEVVAIDWTGAALPIRVVLDPTSAQRHRRQRSLRRRRLETGSGRGSLAIGKRDVLLLRQEFRLSMNEIARIAGVSRHRVRQILALLEKRHSRKE